MISTVSWVGGKNPFLGWAYVGAAALFVALGVAGTVRHLVKPRYVVFDSLCTQQVADDLCHVGNSATCLCFRGINPARTRLLLDEPEARAPPSLLTTLHLFHVDPLCFASPFVSSSPMYRTSLLLLIFCSRML